jgi:hypothetical protein
MEHGKESPKPPPRRWYRSRVSLQVAFVIGLLTALAGAAGMVGLFGCHCVDIYPRYPTAPTVEEAPAPDSNSTPADPKGQPNP